MDRYTTPDISKSALITIDTQNDFTLDGGPVQIGGTLEVLPRMAVLLEKYRQNRLPIIHVVRLYLPDSSNADLCRREMIERGRRIVAPGGLPMVLGDIYNQQHGAKLDSELLLSGEVQELAPGEYVIYKPRWGAFYQTGLEDFLRLQGINTLVFTGCNYPNCPRTSIYEASERDFRIVLVKDAISQLYPRGEIEMRNIGVNILTTDEVTGSVDLASGNG